MMGHTINVMTLGGLALAVGILVDDATVEIENMHRNMALAPLTRAILDGAQQRWIPLGMRLIWNSAFRIRSADRQPDYRQPDIRWLVQEAP